MVSLENFCGQTLNEPSMVCKPVSASLYGSLTLQKAVTYLPKQVQSKNLHKKHSHLSYEYH